MRKLIFGLLALIILPYSGYCADIFGGEIQKAAHDLVAAWRTGDLQAMKRYYKDLILYETYQLSTGNWSVDKSYLSNVPENQNDLDKIAASIFVIYLNRESGIDLNPRNYFSNKEFQIEVSP